MSQSSDGELFHTVGEEMEKARLLSFVLVLAVTADLVVDDLSRALAESCKPCRLSQSNKVMKLCRRAIAKDIIHT